MRCSHRAITPPLPGGNVRACTQVLMCSAGKPNQDQAPSCTVIHRYSLHPRVMKYHAQGKLCSMSYDAASHDRRLSECSCFIVPYKPLLNDERAGLHSTDRQL